MQTENALGRVRLYLLGVLKGALIKGGARVFKMAVELRSYQSH